MLFLFCRLPVALLRFILARLISFGLCLTLFIVLIIFITIITIITIVARFLDCLTNIFTIPLYLSVMLVIF